MKCCFFATEIYSSKIRIRHFSNKFKKNTKSGKVHSRL